MKVTDSADPEEIVWFRAPAGAKWMEGPTPFRSRNYSEYHENDGIGEQEGPPDPCCFRRPTRYYNGRPPAPYTGRERCGTDAAWRGEPNQPLADWFTTNYIGQAPCCASDPLILAEGGSAEGGGWPPGLAAAAWTGGSAEGGPGGVVPPEAHVIGGAGGEGGGSAEEADGYGYDGGDGGEGGGSAAASAGEAVSAQGGGEGGGAADAVLADVFGSAGGGEAGGTAGSAAAVPVAGGEGDEGGGAAGVNSVTTVAGDGGGEAGGTAADAVATAASGQGGGEGGGSAAAASPAALSGAGGSEGGGQATYAVTGSGPPCPTGATYSVVLPPIGGAFPCVVAGGVYSMAWVGGQSWQAINGPWVLTMNLGVFPYTLTWSSFAGFAQYQATGFSCGGSNTFTLFLSSACTGWPPVVTVNSP